MEQSTSNNKTEVPNSSLLIYKDEEKLMSESLYRNLHVLARFYEPTAEFLFVFQPFMFIKSNAKAFFPVLHFIFNCFGAAEFSRRFRWPLLDKLAETNFRKAAVDYMNHLNVTHQLGLQTLQLSNIHIPGGLKFIKIIHKFTYLALKLEVAKPEHGPLPDVGNIPDADDMLEKLEAYVERGMNFATKLQVQSDKLSQRINELRNMMEFCFDSTAGTELKRKEICWACLQKEWQDDLDRSVRDDVGPQLEIVNSFSKRAVQLNELLTKLFVERRKNVIEYDKDQLVVAQTILKQMHPDLEQVIDGIVNGKTINFYNLFKVFSVVLPKITEKLETFKSGDLEAYEYELNEIVHYDAIATKYQNDCTEFNEFIQPFIDKDRENFQKFCENNFDSSFNILATPIAPRLTKVSKIRNRLGFINDSMRKNQIFKEPAVHASVSTNMSKLRTRSSSSLSHCGSHDAALQLLTKPKSRANLSQSSMPNMSVLGKFSTPRLSSTMAPMAGMRKNPESELKFLPSFAMTPTRVFSENVTETESVFSPNGVSVVRKIETTTSVIHMNQPHSRSPTGRFRSAQFPPDFAAIMHQNKNLKEIVNGTSMDRVETGTNDQRANVENEKDHEVVSNGNHNQSMASSNLPFIESVEPGVEFIGNISDSVLNDISTE